MHRKTLSTCAETEGAVVVVDVLRAFTTTAFAFDRGAVEIFLVSSVQQAFALQQREPDLLLMGEVNGYPIDGFDLPNSPTVIKDMDLTNKRLAMRTTAGTQGVVLCSRASQIYVASLSVATATANIVKQSGVEEITFVDSGVRASGGGEEDMACSDYIASIVTESPLCIETIHKRVRNSKAALKFNSNDNIDFLLTDLELALETDRYSFAMQMHRENDDLILRKVNLV